jgi:hypothetical protein
MMDVCFFRIFRAKARRTFKQNRRASWRNFVSKLNCHTPMNKVWNMVQKIKGKNNKTNVLHLKDGQCHAPYPTIFSIHLTKTGDCIPPNSLI